MRDVPSVNFLLQLMKVRRFIPALACVWSRDG